MSTTSSARPGLRAHVDSTRLSFQDLVTRVTAIIGRKLTAYIAGVDVRTVDRWMRGSNPYGDGEARLRFTYHFVSGESYRRSEVHFLQLHRRNALGFIAKREHRARRSPEHLIGSRLIKWPGSVTSVRP